jgi:1-acyl-sn-glycerol-3-phosphate acyltransferase
VAVNPPEPAPGSDAVPTVDGPTTDTPAAAAAAAPGRHQEFAIEPKRSMGYRTLRGIFDVIMRLWFRPKVVGREYVPATGPVILAPVHRSFADFGFASFCTKRKLFFMTKDSMWKNKWLGRLLLYVGAFPVHRESADREALQRAEEVLKRGEVLVLFPEGTRRAGPVIENLMEGAAFLSARTGAPIVPIGIGGSDLAMPKGQSIPRPHTIQVVIGPALPAPARTGGGRVSRSAVHQATEELVGKLQDVYDQAKAKTGRYETVALPPKRA